MPSELDRSRWKRYCHQRSAADAGFGSTSPDGHAERLTIPRWVHSCWRHTVIVLRHSKAYLSACVWIVGGPVLIWQGRWLDGFCLLAAAGSVISILCVHHGASHRRWPRIAIGSGLAVFVSLTAMFVRDVVLR